MFGGDYSNAFASDGMLRRKGNADFGSHIHHAVQRDFGMVLFRNVFDNGKTQPGAACFFRTAFIHPVKPLKNTALAFHWDANTSVLYGQHCRAVLRPQHYPDAAAQPIVTDGVVKEVINQLLQLGFVRADRLGRSLKRKLYARALCGRLQPLHAAPA